MRSSTPVSVEVCAYSLFSCLAADRAGAQRVELCASPWEGGTTPSAGLVEQALQETSLEIHAMVRPRGGDFVYDETEKQAAVKKLGSKPEITRFKGLGEISPEEFGRFIGAEMRKEPVMLLPETHIQQVLEYYMGKNTPDRQEFIIDNLKVELDKVEEVV